MPSYNLDNPCGDVGVAKAHLQQLGLNDNVTILPGPDPTKIRIEGERINTSEVAKALQALGDEHKRRKDAADAKAAENAPNASASTIATKPILQFPEAGAQGGPPSLETPGALHSGGPTGVTHLNQGAPENVPSTLPNVPSSNPANRRTTPAPVRPGAGTVNRPGAVGQPTTNPVVPSSNPNPPAP